MSELVTNIKNDYTKKILQKEQAYLFLYIK